MGEREDSPFSATHHRNPKPRCGASPLPILHPRKCPAYAQCQGIYPHQALRWGGVPKMPNYNSQSPPGPGRGGTSWFSPTLADSPCIPVSSLPGERLPASNTQRLHPDQKGVRLYIVSRANTPPLTPSPGFSLPKERGQCLTGTFPGLLPSLPSSAPSSRKSVLIWQLCPTELSAVMGMF